MGSLDLKVSITQSDLLTNDIEVLIQTVNFVMNLVLIRSKSPGHHEALIFSLKWRTFFCSK